MTPTTSPQWIKVTPLYWCTLFGFAPENCRSCPAKDDCITYDSWKSSTMVPPRYDIGPPITPSDGSRISIWIRGGHSRISSRQWGTYSVQSFNTGHEGAWNTPIACQLERKPCLQYHDDSRAWIMPIQQRNPILWYQKGRCKIASRCDEFGYGRLRPRKDGNSESLKCILNTIKYIFWESSRPLMVDVLISKSRILVWRCRFLVLKWNLSWNWCNDSSNILARYHYSPRYGHRSRCADFHTAMDFGSVSGIQVSGVRWNNSHVGSIQFNGRDYFV